MPTGCGGCLPDTELCRCDAIVGRYDNRSNVVQFHSCRISRVGHEAPRIHNIVVGRGGVWRAIWPLRRAPNIKRSRHPPPPAIQPPPAAGAGRGARRQFGRPGRDRARQRHRHARQCRRSGVESRRSDFQERHAARPARNSTLGVTFDDETTFSLSADTRIVVNEFVYQEGGSGNAASFNVAIGTAAFVASLVAKTGDMTITTPDAALGIRGTTGVVDVPAAGGAAAPTIKLYPDADGHVGQIEVFDRQGNRLGALTQGASAFAIRPGAGGRHDRRALPDSAAGGGARPRRVAAAERDAHDRPADVDPAAAIALAQSAAAEQSASAGAAQPQLPPAAAEPAGRAGASATGATETDNCACANRRRTETRKPMRAYQLPKGGAGIESVVQVERPDPKPGHRQVLVKVKACSLNFRDLGIVRGSYRMPVRENVIPLSDGAGEVVAVGPGVAPR